VNRLPSFPISRAAVLSVLPLLALAACTSDQEAEAPRTGAAGVSELSEEEIMERAREIHARVISIDTHIDIPNNFAAAPDTDPGVRGRFQNDLPKMREGGLDAAFFIVYVGQGDRTPEGYANAIRLTSGKFDGIRRMAYEMYPDQIDLAYSAADVERIHGEGKLVALIGVENAYAIGTDVAQWARYHELGARYVSLTHNGYSDFGDAAVRGAPRDQDADAQWGGLSPLGEEAVDELNRLGIMVDVSHASKETMMDIVARSRAPVIASHSSIKAVADHPRNLDDEQLRAIAANNGVAQTTALGGFVKVQPQERADAIAELRAAFRIESGADIQALDSEDRANFDAGMADIEERFPPATLADYIDHVDHAVNLVGVDHVGISSDFDGGGGVVGWMDTSETLNVTVELVRRGYSEEEIRKLWGGNLLRVMRDAERVARELQRES